jgi:ACS family D-galactonate transporter-like MFS transporter
VRKTLIGAGQTGLGGCLIAAAIAPDSIFAWVLAPAGIFMGMSGGNCWAVTQTVAGPRVAGRWAGVQNFVGNIAGGFAPMVTGYLLGRTGQFYWPLVVAAVISWIGALSWVFAVGPVEPVEWEKEISNSRLGIAASPAADAVQP